MTTVDSVHGGRSYARSRHPVFRWAGALIAGAVSCWFLAALWFDLRPFGVKAAAMIVYLVFMGAIWRGPMQSWKKWSGWLLIHGLILGWWLSLRPADTNEWQVDVSRLPWAERDGSRVILHEVRNFSYRTEFDYTPKWETRVIDLERVQGADVFLTHWGVPLVAHSIVSFRFADGTFLATSIEARKMKGQSFSALRGFFRQYEVIYLVAEERDVVRLRTNYRRDEDVYLYRSRLTPDDARRLLLAYFGWMNAARTRPEWYNAVTKNCGTPVIGFLADEKIGGLKRWDWRGILAGEGDKMLYALGDLVDDGLSFAELKRQAHINPSARSVDAAPDFSQRIRAGRAGFAAPFTPAPKP